MKPIFFVIMPYGRKATQTEAVRDAATIDFNSLWDYAYASIIKKLGYAPIRTSAR